MNTNALFKISYGLYVLTAKEDGIDNGCIINTLSQVTDTPLRVCITVNKSNKTHDMIMNTREFNVSVISENADFSLFENFGFKSGKNVNKFENFKAAERAGNSIYYITEACNAYLCCKVLQTVDFGTHTMFVSEVRDAQILSDSPSVTYDYYHKNIKPKPQSNSKKGYRCKICGYVYEGEELPADFVCPVCKHGANDFEKI